MMIIVIPSVLFVIILLLISLFIYIIKNPEKLDRWSYLYSKYLAHKTEKNERKIISKNIDYKISSVTKRLNQESEGIIPFGLRIKWIDTDKIDSYVQKDEVIVIMKREDNCDKNIVDACIAFVPKAILPKSRNSVDPQILKSIDTFMVKSILNNGNYDSAYNYYMNRVYNPVVSADGLLNTYLETIKEIDAIGFFTRILLEEYRRLGNKLYGTAEEQLFFKESVDFLNFLKNLAKRKPGDNTQLAFIGDRIKIAIVYVAKRTTYYFVGSDAYVSRIDKDIKLGAQRIFLLSYSQFFEESIEDKQGFVIAVERRKEFITLNEVEARMKENDQVRIIKKQKYQTKDVSGNKRSAKYIIYEVIK
jgi:hypothetical protein